jgi:hypothetical protein
VPEQNEDLNAGLQQEDLEERITEDYREEILEQKPDEEERKRLLAQHQNHLVRETTSRYSVDENPDGPVEITKVAEAPDTYCFTCEEWVGLSGLELTGTPRSRKDAYYLGGPPQEVVEARRSVRDSLADMVERVAATVPRVESTEDAMDFIEAEQEKARERVENADNGGAGN